MVHCEKESKGNKMTSKVEKYFMDGIVGVYQIYALHEWMPNKFEASLK